MIKRTGIFLLLCGFLQPALRAQQHAIPFIENKGLWPDQVVAMVGVPGGNLFVEKDGFTYDFVDTRQLATIDRHNPKSITLDHLNCHSFGLKFKNSQASAVLKENVLPGIYNYFLGNDPSKWVSGARSYRTIRFENLYRGISAVIYSSQDELKYDFIVLPGGDPADIVLQYEHASGLYLDRKGNLVIKTSVNEVTELKPYAYQLIRGDTVQIPARFYLEGNEVRIDLPSGYNRKHKLVIDPTLKFSTFSGSKADNFGSAATYDKEGFLYAAGTVHDNRGYPATPGAYQTQFRSTGENMPDMGITKYDTTGYTLIYSTLLGGNSSDVPHSLIVNQQGELYIFGTTGSKNYPVTANVFQTGFKGGPFIAYTDGPGASFPEGSDLVVTKLGAMGDTLLASTFVGGTNNDGLNRDLNYNYADVFRGEIQLDENDNCYVASCTYSVNFPTTVNAAQQKTKGNQEAVVFSLSPDLKTMRWCTYLGDSGHDASFSLDFTREGNLITGGATTSANFLVSTNAVQKTYGGSEDGFFAELSPDGRQILYLSYWGSDRYDQIFQVEVDRNNNKFVLGQTEDTGNRFYDGTVYGQPNSGQFISKFNPAKDAVVWTTTIGKSDKVPNISPVAFLVDVCDKIYLTGWGGYVNTTEPFSHNNSTDVTGLPISPDALQSTTEGNDFYIMILKPDAAGLEYATFFGGKDGFGEHVDGGTSRFDPRGIIYQSVCAGCRGTSDFPTTQNAWSPTNESNGGCNNAVFKMEFEFSGVIADFTRPIKGCIRDTLDFKNFSSGAAAYAWNMGDGSQQKTGKDIKHVYAAPGTYRVTLYAMNENACNKIDSITKEVTIQFSGSQALPDTLLCLGDTLQIGTAPENGKVYRWIPGSYLSDSTIANPKTFARDTITYLRLTKIDACYDTLKVRIVTDGALADFDYTGPVCQNDTVRFTNLSAGGDQYSWIFGDGDASTDANPVHLYRDTGEFEIKLVTKKNAQSICPVIDSLSEKIVIYPNTTHTLPDILICEGLDTVRLGEAAVPGAQYTWSPASEVDNANTARPLGNAIDGLVFTRIMKIFHCSDTASVGLKLLSIDLVVSKDSLVCKGASNINLVADGQGLVKEFQWSKNPSFQQLLNDGPSDSSIVADPQLPVQTYYVRGISDYCEFLDSVRIITFTDSTVTLPPAMHCPGDTTMIGFSSFPPDAVFSWTPSTYLTGTNVPNPGTFASDTIIYTLSVTLAGCTQDFLQQVNVRKLKIDADSLVNICDKNSPTVLRAYGFGYLTSYTWSDRPDFSTRLNPNPADSTVQVKPTVHTTYYVQGSDGTCFIIDSTIVHANFIKLNLADTQSLCSYDTLRVRAFNPENKTLSYNWGPKGMIISGANTSQILVLPQQSTWYGLEVTDSVGCKLRDSVLVYVSPLVTLQADILYSDTLQINNKPVILTGLPEGNYLYRWSPSEYASAPNQRITEYLFNDTITVTLTVIDRDCMNATDIKLYYKELQCGPPDIFVPNAFTPNGDNNNDEVFVRGRYIRYLYFAIYDRWGEKIFETNDQQIGWDGTYKGRVLDPAVFVYYLEATCYGLETYFEKGNITLIR